MEGFVDIIRERIKASQVYMIKKHGGYALEMHIDLFGLDSDQAEKVVAEVFTKNMYTNDLHNRINSLRKDKDELMKYKHYYDLAKGLK